MLAHRIASEHADASAVGLQQPAHQPDRGGLAGAVRTDQTEHLAAIDTDMVSSRSASTRRRIVLMTRSRRRSRVMAWHWQEAISASTGMPCLSMPWRLSTAIFTRYTSFDRSSAVCTLRGVNSAFGEMKLIVPGCRLRRRR